MVAKATLKKVTARRKSNAGRRTFYNPDIHPEKVKKLLKEGCTKHKVAEIIGIGYTTFFEWENKFSEFANAIKDGCAIADGDVEMALYKSACGFTGPDGKYYPPNVTSCIFWLKNRNPKDWRDRKEYKADVEVSDLSEEEIDRQIKALLEDAGV